jgi:hypothetical protein
MGPPELALQLRSATQQLSQSLTARQDGDAWMHYLAPHRVDALIQSGNSAELRELLTHYEGVLGNPQLRHITALNGFTATITLLRQYVGHSMELAEPLSDEPTIETLPIPEPKATSYSATRPNFGG